PTMKTANNAAPWFGTAESIIIIILIYNSIVGFLYPFLARFSTPGTNKYKNLLVGSLVVGYCGTSVGLVERVNVIYPLFAYVGMVIGIMLTVRWVYLKFKARQLAEKISDNDEEEQ